ncbi:MAG: aspartate kinase [Chloroflexi bacterium]|nr:aspartate kinase [Chloroflexota bacterium]
MRRLVMKFGGTSVGNAQATRSTAALILKHRQDWDEIVVVISAMAGITDQIIITIETACCSNPKAYKAQISAIRSQVNQVINELFQDRSQRFLIRDQIAPRYEELLKLCQRIHNIGKITPRLYDATVSLGERINIHILSTLLIENGLASQAVDASELIVTNECFQNATPLQPATRIKVENRLKPLLAKKIVPVVTGFISATEAGEITTLGRGGSDYTAAILANSLDADEIWIWTDVDGVLTTDPVLVSDARLIPEISYSEAYELAFFGAKVLHPKTIFPAEEGNIPIRIKNTFNPNSPGTLIVPNNHPKGVPIKAVTSINDVYLITIPKRKSDERPAIIKTAKKGLKDQGIDLLGIFQTTDARFIHFAISSQTPPQQISIIEAELSRLLPGRGYSKNKPSAGQAMVSAIGNQIENMPLIIAKVNVLLEKAGINTSLFGYQTSQNSLRFLIPCQDSEKALRKIHSEVILNASF